RTTVYYCHRFDFRRGGYRPLSAHFSNGRSRITSRRYCRQRKEMTTPVKRIAFEDLLVEKGLIPAGEKEALVETARTGNRTVAGLLLERGTLTDDLIGQVLADQYGLPWNDLREFRVPTALMEAIPVELMHRYEFVPMEQEDQVLTIAIAKPQDLRMIDELEHQLGYER